MIYYQCRNSSGQWGCQNCDKNMSEQEKKLMAAFNQTPEDWTAFSGRPPSSCELEIAKLEMDKVGMSAEDINAAAKLHQTMEDWQKYNLPEGIPRPDVKRELITNTDVKKELIESG